MAAQKATLPGLLPGTVPKSKIVSGLFWAKYLILLVQLGGLEPPTSCSTDRRSNQLSYNCILCRPKKGLRTRRKLGATPSFGKAGHNTIGVIRTYKKLSQKQKARAHRPGFSDFENAGSIRRPA